MDAGIAGVTLTIDDEAVVVTSASPLRVLSSAVMGGGAGEARAVANVHVPKGFRCEASPDVLARFVAARALPAPVVGLLTAAATEGAESDLVVDGDLTVLAVVTVGLSNRSAAGRSAVAAWAPSTINTVVVADADVDPAALVNLVVTATEAKTLALVEAGVRADDGSPASGTSTDAVVVAATARGRFHRFGGPVSELGAAAGRAVRTATARGVARWLERHA